MFNARRLAILVVAGAMAIITSAAGAAPSKAPAVRAVAASPQLATASAGAVRDGPRPVGSSNGQSSAQEGTDPDPDIPEDEDSGGPVDPRDPAPEEPDTGECEPEEPAPGECLPDTRD